MFEFIGKLVVGGILAMFIAFVIVPVVFLTKNAIDSWLGKFDGRS